MSHESAVHAGAGPYGDWHDGICLPSLCCPHRWVQVSAHLAVRSNAEESAFGGGHLDPYRSCLNITTPPAGESALSGHCPNGVHLIPLMTG